MRKKMIMLCLLFWCVIGVAQHQPQNDVSGMSTDLGVGSRFQYENTSVKFIQVISDSRCPRQVTCIWPGEAKVLLGITVNENYSEEEVVVSGIGAEFLLAEDILMKVSHLRPYPQTGKSIAPEDYCLWFIAKPETVEDQ